ncbi:hypothetical protein Y032_0106g3761 [Ancylostoma ceylanicum]|nr:hypothetical protein Y032_0106g3761 [Ancylostoma ceylanicum]
MRIVIFATVAVAVFARWDGEDIPGVSAASMEKLRQIMNPRPTSREEFKQKMHQWKSGLSESERALVLAVRLVSWKPFGDAKTPSVIMALEIQPDMMKTVIVLLMILAVVVCQQRWWGKDFGYMIAANRYS